MNATRLDLKEIRQIVAKQLNIDAQDIQDDDDLFMLGLDSMSLMTLVSVWRASGISVEFQDLVENPTVTGWLQRLNQ